MTATYQKVKMQEQKLVAINLAHLVRLLHNCALRIQLTYIYLDVLQCTFSIFKKL